MWTKGIRKVEGRLKELGRLTDTLKLSNSKSSDKAKSQLKLAKELKNDIWKYLDKAKEEGVQALESQKLSAESEKSRLEKRRKILELGKLAKAYNEAKGTFGELSKIPPEKKTSEIRENLGSVKNTVVKRSEYERNLDLYKNLSIITGLGSTISFAAVILAGILSPLALIIPILFFAGLAGSALLYFKTSSDLSAPEKEVGSITARVRRIGLKPSGRTQKEKITSLGQKLDEINAKRRELNAQLRENMGILKDNLKIEKKPTDEEILEEASKKIRAKRDELGLDAQIPHDEKELGEIKDRLKEIGEKLKGLEDSLKEHKGKLEEFSDRTRELNFQAFLGEELDLKIVNLESLERLAKELDRFASEIEENEITSKTAVEIFEGLESEEEEKISDLFGKDSETAEIFTEITDGRYRTVDYDGEEEKIFVERPSGEKKISQQRIEWI
ncbi:hypothetical protein AKJ43_02485 [candidate division MSBL1 archaeon SCGC-AAA261D19]|uniref:Chromosome partition protein Smc n=1 Tax=candidate division MSBL1 archaeon SCGC-AAA261D19 TaxID=1698273 RepID=A0A133V6Q3_9EURY|nr:hypothetical protein AKJ43_02485 [candidate division MSBL1 archaeon SCGC-AAA261D19]